MKKIELLILWDIDGTLIELPKNSSNRHLESVNQYTQKEQIGINSNVGKTDLGIIRDIYVHNRLNYTKKQLIECLHILDKKSKMEIDFNSINLNPGVLGALDFCQSMGVKNSVLTGNTRFRAFHKLSLAKLINKINLDLSFFGDVDFEREDLVKSAKNYFEKLDKYQILLIGDSIRDILSAKKNNVKIISVSTGKDPYADLKKLNPDLIIKNFDVNGVTFQNFIEKMVSFKRDQ